MIALGMRYKGYCANLGRSFIVDPSKEQEAIYLLLISLQAELLTTLKDGAVAREVYNHALDYVKEKKPELEKNFVKNVGHGVSAQGRFRSSRLIAS